jgi:ATP-dependent DNA helicase RecG
MQPTDPIEKHFPRLNPAQKRGLAKLGIQTVRDLLYHFPARYAAALPESQVANLTVGENVTIYGRVVKTTIKKAWRKKIPIAEMIVEDHTGQIKAVWYHQAYMAKKAAEGSFVHLSGKVSQRKGEVYIANPELAPIDAATLNKETLFADPYRSETSIQKAFSPPSRRPRRPAIRVWWWL